MHTLLEAYLEQVAAHLSALPPKRRNEELREMRQHLLDAVTVNKELGQSEEDAAANAVMQFGTPEDLGGNLVWVWKRERIQNSRNLAGAAVTAMAVICLISFLMNQSWFDLFLNTALPRAFLIYLGRHPGYGMDFTQAMVMMMFGLAGLAAGSLFPQRAVGGVCLGLGLFWLGFAIVDGVGQLGALISADGLIHEGRGGWMLSAVIAGWLGSRWRTWRTARLGLAKN